MRTALSDDFDGEDESGSSADQHREPSSDEDGDVHSDDEDVDEYPNVIAWVEQWFAPMIRRRITDYTGTALSWDSRWWMYPEVVGRLIALHEAWEEAYAAPKRSAMSSWWIQHLEPHLRILLDSENGPMAQAKPDQTWGGFPALPTATDMPPEARAAVLRDGSKPRLGPRNGSSRTTQPA